MNSGRACFSLIIVLSLCLGCALSDEKTYEYRTIHESVLRDDMQAMANSLAVLANLHFNADTVEEQRQSIVNRELDNIENIASSIGGGEVVTNYSVINRYMGSFLYDVSLAKHFANQAPPNYVPANRLLNSCLGCHSSL